MPREHDIPYARYRAGVGIDATERPSAEPTCRTAALTTAADVGRTIGYLHGEWDVQRRISDRRSGQEGVFRGTARFRPAVVGQVLAGGQVLEYAEDGELRFGSHHGPARRRLIFCDRPDGAADVRFADGREFYRLDLRADTWQAEHPCRADRYRVTVIRLGPDSFTEIWLVAGPGKDYQLQTTYRRSGSPASALPPVTPAGAEVTGLAGGPGGAR